MPDPVKRIYKLIRKFPEDMGRLTDQLRSIVETLLRMQKYSIITVTFGAVADAETTIAHGLGNIIPNNYSVVSKDLAAIVYLGGTAWTNINAYLKSDTANLVCKIKFWAE